MRASRRARLTAVVAIAALAAGCATRYAPAGWLPYAEEVQREAYGCWIRVELARALSPAGEPPGGGGAGPAAPAGKPAGPVLGGELLAITEDSLYTLAGSTVTPVPLAVIRGATLELYDPQSREAAAMTTAGTLLTITHGAFLFITAPLWLIVGSSATATLSGQGRVHADLVSGGTSPSSVDVGSAPEGKRSVARVVTWKDLRIHARFPQGLPPELDRSRLRERPRPVHTPPRRPKPGSITE